MRDAGESCSIGSDVCFSSCNKLFASGQYVKAISCYMQLGEKHPGMKKIIEANIELAKKRVRNGGDLVADVDVVVPVFNALEDVKKCLESLERHTDGLEVKVIVVNDGSDIETSEWLREYCEGKLIFNLIENSKNKGYTYTVNTGLKASTAEYVITQNSDTIVTKGWLRGMIRCMNSNSAIGIVGPLSNAATWQNVPELYDNNNSFAVNELPAGLSLDKFSLLISNVSTRTYPRTPFVNGFCFMIKREVIEKIGFMDQENFPIGYGEENDFCIRAANAGFELAIADDTYVYHSKSKSFGHTQRKQLSKQGSNALKRKHTPEKFNNLVQKVKNTQALDFVRSEIKLALSKVKNIRRLENLLDMRVCFLLPVRGKGGGVHSIVQETIGMRRLGIDAKVCVQQKHFDNYLEFYADIAEVNEVFIGFSDDDLSELLGGFDVVVGTIFTSMKMVEKVVRENPLVTPAYYIQDYEPMFYEEGDPLLSEARESYSLIPHALRFAKTQWIIDEVYNNHKLPVEKVKPSIDHDVYKPRKRDGGSVVKVLAMVRPQTPRRGAARTMQLLSMLARRYQGKIEIHIFGCEDNEPSFQDLTRDFNFVNHGVLLRPQVAELLSTGDLFIDLSDYQAFGRTALEAMASGCAAVVPMFGGANEYAVNNYNCIVVDTLDVKSSFERIAKKIDIVCDLERLKLNALVTASAYSIHSAAVSEASLLFNNVV